MLICIDQDVFDRLRPVIRHLCVGLIDLASSVRLLSSTSEAQVLSLGPVQTIEHQPLVWPFRARRFRALLEKVTNPAPTVVHAMSAGAYYAASQVAREFDADLVLQVSAVADVAALKGLHSAGPHTIICASQPLLERCEQAGVAPAERLRVIRLGVPSGKEPTCFMDEQRAPSMLATAGFVPGEGVPQLLEAVRRLHERGHRFLTFLLGSGPYESILRRQVTKSGLEAAVVFAQPEGDVQQAMFGADVFVEPAAQKALNVRVMQALAQGMAVVAVDGGVNDALIADRTALICKGSTAVDLADCIERLLNDHEAARRLASGAIEHMRTHQSMSRMADLTYDIYREMAAAHATYSLEANRR